MATMFVSPWINFYREVEEFFSRDPKVRVLYDDDTKHIDLYVEGEAKAEALAMMLPTERKFGNVKVQINVVPANTNEKSCGDLCLDAFDSNEALSFVQTIHGLFSNDIHYVVFDRTVVQYYNDDLGDVYGQRSCLYQDLAQDIFTEADGVYFCTDKDDAGLLTGEFDRYWP